MRIGAGFVRSLLFALLSGGLLPLGSASAQDQYGWSRIRHQPRITTAEGPQQQASPADRKFVPGRVLVQFREGVSSFDAHGMINAQGAISREELSGLNFHVVEVSGSDREEEVVQELKSRPEVLSAELDRILSPEQVSPNDPLYSAYQWHLPKIAAPFAWTVTTGSSNVVIAILDTGIDASHPDLATKLVPGWNVAFNNSDTHDVYGHGTKVAGAAAAASNNGVGVASVAWNCLVMPVRVSDDYGFATYSTIVSGIYWAADHGARVANVSYAATDSTTVRSAAEYFQNKGGVVVISAGNDGYTTSNADNPYVLTVSATDHTDALFSWSNRGNNIDLAAPGSVYTTVMGGGYAAADGTSYSAPIVAGVAALVFSSNWMLTGAQAQSILKNSADDLGGAGWDTSFGWGRVNAARAVSAASGSPLPTGDTTAPTVRIDSPQEGARVSGLVSVSVSASDNVRVTKVELYIDGVLKSSSKSEPFTLRWDTKKTKPGTHTLRCKAYDAAGNTGSSAVVNVTK